MAEHNCENCAREYCAFMSPPSGVHCGYWKSDAPAVNRWIPCSERLPDHYDDILFCERDRTIHKGYMYWDGTFIENYVKFRKSDIVAWMPLPEPPESEVQE